MKKLLNWLWYSSQDPQKVSLTIKSTGILLIPYAVQVVGLSCSLGHVCIPIDASSLEALVSHIANVVLYVLLTLGAMGALFGAFRKMYYTIAK